MRQRLGLAAALLKDPDLLVLDEPANGLDPAGIVAMRETLRHLASTGKTVFVSSHLLGEVQVLADVVGIIASGRLVREGTLETLLASEAVVRVRVPRDTVEAAIAALTPIGSTAAIVAAGNEPEFADTWLSVQATPDRAGEVNQTLAGAGIFASALESGSDLENLFLELTGGEPHAGSEGTFQGIRT
jgi:ABC-2 type transport system ATP-binding protein